ncbi:MAG TPA: HEXXH motif domain-containing protein, partial [Streptomyces sp.]|nr:HEXXH motif domain-containing protein [Streptomyces sp.]
MFPAVPDRALLELGRTEGGPGTLDLLVRDQDTRRLLVLRAVLDAAESADRAVCTPAQKARVREDWGMLVEADGVSGVPDGGPGTRRAVAPAGPARALLFQPLTGPWARSCLRGLDPGDGTDP